MRYPKFLTTAFALVLTVAVAVADGRADAQKTSGLSKSDVEKIVRDYLIANPEVIQDAIEALQAKREASENARTKAAMEGTRRRPPSAPNDASLRQHIGRRDRRRIL